ncbi:MAG: HAMP domain-containing sensor histidine kinase [Coprobacillus sp.]
MIYILLIVIIILCYMIYRKEKRIKFISKQVNEILFQQKDLYVRQYKEGSLSILESEIFKLVNLLYEKNHLLVEDKKLLKNSLEDISHQIKTPLTSLNLIHERLREAEGNDKNKLLREQKRLLYKIESLVIFLLKMAQMDAHVVEFKKEKISYQQLFNQLLETFEIQLELNDVQFISKIEEDKDIIIDILWTLEALSNIIKNCIEHSHHNGIIEIIIKDNPLYTEIIIQDNGKGIDQKDLTHIFERFYKGENSDQKSVGIGLALSQMIIENQNGTIGVENIYPGAKFTIHFYKEVI